MRPADAHHAVGESLQADVMRFMAIIAFCLIAILALVRNAEPVAATPPARTPAAPDPSARLPDSSPAAPSTTRAPAPRPATLTPAPPPATRTPAPPAVAAPPVTREPAAPRAAAQPPSPAPAQDQGLILRFASDGDFLRLVHRGRIRVFAFNDQEVLRLDPALHFEPAAAPGSIHELMPRTIPAPVAAALAGPRDAVDYRWGVVLSERMSREIRRFVEDGAAGELIIDRFGEVNHHEA